VAQSSAKSTATPCPPPSGLIDAIFEDAQQKGQQSQRHVADFVEEQHAALGLADPTRHAAPPRRSEGPSSQPKSSASIGAPGSAAQLTATNGLLARRLAWCSRRAKTSLPLPVSPMTPALAAGNCVVLKPAAQTPVSILALMEIIGDLLPPGVPNVPNVVNGFGLEAGKTRRR
jgi:hypothetical protein